MANDAEIYVEAVAELKMEIARRGVFATIRRGEPDALCRFWDRFGAKFDRCITLLSTMQADDPVLSRSIELMTLLRDATASFCQSPAPTMRGGIDQSGPSSPD